ncbi:photoreceptor cilium actin regulator [Tachyglossus aculeatus]|uniref:photoreceptor cilium actin regulator n=1 Tax=Tachyglossus aculeatus TaxID=9261 RepID=UPI0018F599DF|nr:photoreceptor cilium actin regulator [Tachyglossus aculeatus]
MENSCLKRCPKLLADWVRDKDDWRNTMGCAPSHSDIVHHVAKSGIQFLKKPKAILPVRRADNDGFAIPLLVKGSTSFDGGGDFFSGERRRTQQQSSTWDQDVTENPFPFLGTALPSRGMGLQGTTPEEEITGSDLMAAQRNPAEGGQVAKQSSDKSDRTSFSREERKENNARKGKKPRSHRLSKEGHRDKAKTGLSMGQADKKVDFPEPLVKAHHSAYAYLHPTLAKYDTIIRLANQAAQTQLAVQQMVTFQLLRFGEINQLLEEIAQGGEALLKEAGGHLVWPEGKEGDQERPDLLQQLLQYTVNKMQLLNSTAASLTSRALQDSSSYFRSAANHLEDKLHAKKGFDKRLCGALALLERAAVRPCGPQADDLPLHSEDSGLGADNESIRSLDKLDTQVSCDHPVQQASTGKFSFLAQREAGAAEGPWPTGPSSSRSHDCALDRNFRDIFYPAAPRKGTASLSGPPHPPRKPWNSELVRSSSWNSLETGGPEGSEHFRDDELADSPSIDEDEDSSPREEEEEEDNSHTGTGHRNLRPQRPKSCPAATGNMYRFPPKQRESREAREMILKMKDAISDRIKFVPAKLSHREWAEEESGKIVLSARPSTVGESRRAPVEQRRSKSEESLRSQAEDPTLLELQRVQRDLSQKLEMFYVLSEKRQEPSRREILRPRAAAAVKQDSNGNATSSSTIGKLKASLAKNFSILPSQEKIILQKHPPGSSSQPSCERTSQALSEASPSTQEPDPAEEENEALGTQRWSGWGHATRPSVKKLIETFSPPEGLSTAKYSRDLGPISCIRKLGVPIMPPRLPAYRELAPLYPRPRVIPGGEREPLQGSPPHWIPSTTSFSPLPRAEASQSDMTSETEDSLEDLPPPPPEVLMDHSFHSLQTPDTQEQSGDSTELHSKPAPVEHGPSKITPASQRMKASVKPFCLLPSKNLTSYRLPVTRMESQARKPALNPDSPHEAAHDREEAEEIASLYQQSRKVIPLHHPSNVPGLDKSKENKDPGGARLLPKPNSPDTPRPSQEKSQPPVRRVSPSRIHWSPRTSPPSSHRVILPATQPTLPQNEKQPSPPLSPRTSSPPTRTRAPSPPTSPKVPSPPTSRKLPSPPPQPKLPHPLCHQRSPPTQHKLPSPPSYLRETSPPPLCPTPSPPTSPSQGIKGPRNAGNGHQTATKVASNTRSIFCLATSSLFEAQIPGPLVGSQPEAGGQSAVPGVGWRSRVHPRKCWDAQRQTNLSALNPQPYIRRTCSDRRPRGPLQVPGSACLGASSEPLLSQAR